MTSILFGFVVFIILQHNYINDEAQYNLASIISILDADTFRLENLGYEHPHGPILALAPLAAIPWLKSLAPFVVSVCTTSLLLTLWYRQLTKIGYGQFQRIVLLLLIAINPAILWSATSGGDEAIALFIFYLMYRNSLRLIDEKDIRSFIALGLVLAAFFYFDPISIYLFISFFPLIPLIIPIPLLRESPLSIYIIVGMPLLIIISMWIYFNLIFFGETLAFLNTYQSKFTGAMANAETLPWLRDYGGQLVTPILKGFVYVVASYPVLLYIMWQKHRGKRQLFTSTVLIFFPVISIGVSTYAYFLASPTQVTALIMGSVLAEITRIGDNKFNNFSVIIFLLLIGTASSWYIFTKDNYSYTKQWSAALLSSQNNPFSDDIKVGQWMAANHSPTMIDFQSGYRAIISRGDAEGLILPFTHEYRLAMRTERPKVAQIAVPDPDTFEGKRDKINIRFPHLYESGLPGYERVYDENGWRIYRHTN